MLRLLMNSQASPASHPPPPPAAQDPVAGPSGHIFSREAILENLLAQKKANKRKLKAWEAQQREEARKVRRRLCVVLCSVLRGGPCCGWLCTVLGGCQTYNAIHPPHPTPPHLPS